MDEYDARKAINFDLDTNALKEYYCQITGNNYTQAYTDIRNFMMQNGFVHRQGSGYISFQLLREAQITQLAIKMQNQLSWILLCAKKIDVTDIGTQYDLLREMKGDAQQIKQKIMEQFLVEKYSNETVAVDAESLMYHHPEINLHGKQWEQKDINQLEDKYKEDNRQEIYSAHKAINFDLDTNALKEYYYCETGKDYTQAYYDIKRFMTQNGFIHRQGSGYASIDERNKQQITYLSVAMQKQFPWLLLCAEKIDVTYIRKQYDLLKEMKEDAQQTKEQIIDQYSAGTSSDGATIIDEENLQQDHPEINLYDDEPSPQDYIKRREEHTTELYNEHDSWDQER